MNVPKSEVRSIWTAEDEARLRDLQRRRDEIFSQYRSAVGDAAMLVWTAVPASILTASMTMEVKERMSDALIANADLITAALRPFTKET